MYSLIYNNDRMTVTIGLSKSGTDLDSVQNEVRAQFQIHFLAIFSLPGRHLLRVCQTSLVRKLARRRDGAPTDGGRGGGGRCAVFPTPVATANADHEQPSFGAVGALLSTAEVWEESAKATLLALISAAAVEIVSIC